MPTAAELVIILKAQDTASAVLKKVSAEVSGLDKAGASAGKGVATLSNAFKVAGAAAAGITVAVAGVAALGAALAPAISSAIGFEQAMSGIKAVSGATGGEMQQLSALALRLGADTSFSAREAADGISELVKGGVSVGDVFGGAASAALDLAAAGGVSVGEAATIAANAMNQFSLKGSDMAHVSDLVAGAANASSISVSDFNMSLAAGGSVAAMAGQSIDSFATAVALMGAQGIKGSDAGTSLKAAINNLIPTTDAAKMKMRELGLITADGTNQFINASGGMKSFGEIAEILQTQTADLTESQRLLALELIFGSDGMRAAGVLATQGAEGFAEMGAAMGAAGGAAAIAGERLNNAAGDIEQLKGSLETAAITVGSLFLPAVRAIAQTATSAVNTAVDEFNTLRASAEAIAGERGIGLIPAALLAVEQRIGETLGSSAQQIFHDARTAVEDLANAFATTQRSAAEFADILGTRLSPAVEGVRDAAAGAAPVVAALGDAFGAVGETVEPLTRQFANYLVQQGLVSGKTAELTGQQQEAAAITDLLWTLYTNSPIGKVVTAFGELSAAVRHAQNATTEAATATDAAWQAMIAGAGAVRDQVVARLGEVTAFISALPARFAADGLATGLALVNGIVQGLNPATMIAALVAMVAQSIAAGAQTAAAGAGAIGQAVVSGVVGGIAGGIGSVRAAAANLAQSALASAKAALGVASPSKEFEEVGEDVVAGLVEGIESVAGDAAAAVEDMVAEMQDAAAGFNLVDSLLGDLDTGGQDALANFLRDSERVMEDVGRKAEEIGRKTAEALASAREDAAEAIQGVREGAAGRALELVDNQSLSREIRAVRARFGAQQDEAAEAYDRQREDAEATYKYEKDLAKAKTDDERAEVRARFREAQDDLQRRRQMEDADRAFRKQQAADLQAFNDRLEDEALQRQVTRLQEERDERIEQITQALAEKERKVLDQETRERAALAQSASDKLNDLKERFYDKVGALTEEAKGKFEELFGSVADRVAAAARAVNDLAEAIARVSGAKGAGAGGVGGGAGGGATWANQPQSVRDMFTATHGANAEQQWATEHNREVTAGMGADLPQPTGYDPTSGLPTGPGYYEPVPATPYWQANWDRFNPLPYGTEYPPEAFYGSDSTSKDVFGGNNQSVADNPNYQYAEGGMVPGPPGIARHAIVHGGEMVLTPEQQRERYGVGGDGHTHAIYLDGRLVGQTLEPEITAAQGRTVRLELG